MRIWIFILILCSILMQSCDTKREKSPIEDIRAIMQEQVGAWNNGDIDGFMKGYQQNDSIPFIGKNGITYGYNTITERYKKSYPDKEAMGELSFTDINIKPISDKYAYVTAKWNLKRVSDTLSGYTSLLFEDIDGKWYVIADHSS